jgi:hypothetical protein
LARGNLCQSRTCSGNDEKSCTDQRFEHGSNSNTCCS